MIHSIDAPISVHLYFNHRKHAVYPIKVEWEGREYSITKLGLHHTYRTGRTLFHVYSVQAQTMFFRLILNTETLFWRVEQISDGEPD